MAQAVPPGKLWAVAASVDEREKEQSRGTEEPGLGSFGLRRVFIRISRLLGRAKRVIPLDLAAQHLRNQCVQAAYGAERPAGAMRCRTQKRLL